MKNKFFLLFTVVFLQVAKLASQISFTVASSACVNDTNIIVADTGTNTVNSYTWSSVPGSAMFTSSTSATTGVVFTASGTYTLALTTVNGTVTSSYQQTLTVFSLPVITLSQNSMTTCLTSNFPEYSRPVNLTAAGGVFYIWNPSYTPMAGNNPNGPIYTARPASSTCFSVTGKDANGCKAMTSICVTVVPRFHIQVTPSNTLICKNLPGNLAIYTVLSIDSVFPPAVGLPSSYSYSWTEGSTGGVLTSPFSNSVAVAPSANATFTAQLSDSLHCISFPTVASVYVQYCASLNSLNLMADKVLLYPNPAATILFIELAENTTTAHITVSNMLGNILKETTFEDNRVEVDLTGLSKGIYFLHVRSAETEKIVKFLKE